MRNTIGDADRALSEYFYVREGNTADNIEEGDHADDLDAAKQHLQYFC